VAAAVGLWHLDTAMRAILVFREGEPWSSWMTMIFGPIATLPAALLSFYRRKVAGYVLIFGAAVSFGIFVLAGDAGEHVLGFVRIIYGPMLALGVAFVFLSRRAKPSHEKIGDQINDLGPRPD
jgi:hypothetical protein